MIFEVSFLCLLHAMLTAASHNWHKICGANLKRHTTNAPGTFACGSFTNIVYFLLDLRLKHLRVSDTYQQVFNHLDEAWTVSPELFEELWEFVCWMYASSITTCEVTELRYHIFDAKDGDVESSRLAKSVPTCTSSAQTIKLWFGDSVLGVSWLCQIERDMDGPQMIMPVSP